MNWRGERKLSPSFILFFVLIFFLLGEQLPALPLYLGRPHGEKLAILDLPAGDALHRPIAFVLIGVFNWLLFRTFTWPVAYGVGGFLAIVDQFFLTAPDQRSAVNFISTLTILFAWGVFTLVPYFLYRWIEGKWAETGIKMGILVIAFLNLLLLGFFAFQIYVLHNSHRHLQPQGASRDDQRTTQCRPGDPNNPPDCPAPQTKINSYLGVPCVSNPSPKFTHDLTETDKIFKVTPNSLIASKNQDRVFLWINKNLTDRVPIYAPVEADLVRGVYKISKSVATIDYDLHFQVSCEVWFFINHVSNPVEKIKSLFPSQPVSSTNNLTWVKPPLHFKAGELIGDTTGTAQAHNFDFAVFDLNHKNDLVGSGASNDPRFKNFVCPFNFFPPDLKSQYYQKLEAQLVSESNCR